MDLGATIQGRPQSKGGHHSRVAAIQGWPLSKGELNDELECELEGELEGELEDEMSAGIFIQDILISRL